MTQDEAALQGRRVLVAEDEYMVARALRLKLAEAGAQVLGPVSSVALGLQQLQDDGPPDVALLDVNLGGEMVYPLADALLARGVPLVFATGYDAWAIPARYAHLPRCEKPVELDDLFAALRAACADGLPPAPVPGPGGAVPGAD